MLNLISNLCVLNVVNERKFNEDLSGADCFSADDNIVSTSRRIAEILTCRCKKKKKKKKYTETFFVRLPLKLRVK